MIKKKNFSKCLKKVISEIFLFLHMFSSCYSRRPNLSHLYLRLNTNETISTTCMCYVFGPLKFTREFKSTISLYVSLFSFLMISAVFSSHLLRGTNLRWLLGPLLQISHYRLFSLCFLHFDSQQISHFGPFFPTVALILQMVQIFFKLTILASFRILLFLTYEVFFSCHFFFA